MLPKLQNANTDGHKVPGAEGLLKLAVPAFSTPEGLLLSGPEALSGVGAVLGTVGCSLRPWPLPPDAKSARLPL